MTPFARQRKFPDERPSAIKSYMLRSRPPARVRSAEVRARGTQQEPRRYSPLPMRGRDAKKLSRERRGLSRRGSGQDAASSTVTLTEKTIGAWPRALSSREAPRSVGEISDLAQRRAVIRVGRMRVRWRDRHHLRMRPNVTADAAALCLSGQRLASCAALGIVVQHRIARVRDEDCAPRAFPETRCRRRDRRSHASGSSSMNEYVDIIVPRGGKDLIERVMRESRIPMISTWTACPRLHRRPGGRRQGDRIADNARPSATALQRHGNLLSTSRIARGAAQAPKIYAERSELRGDRIPRAVPVMKSATEQDWYTESCTHFAVPS